MTHQLLSGAWEIAPGETAEGFLPVHVPSQWHLAGLPHHDGPCWYRKRFAVESEAGVPFLRFEGADYRAEVFLNGERLGAHTGYFGPFALPAASALKVGENELLVRVESPRELAGPVWPYRKKLVKGIFNHHDCRPGAWHHANGQDGNTGGLWNDVVLEWRPETHMSGCRIEIHVAEGFASVLVEAGIRGPVPQRVLATLLDPEGRVVAEAEAVPCGDQAHLGLRVVAPRLWWSWDHGDQPLYTLVLIAGEHRLERRVAFRSIAQEGDSWLLNGRRIFLRGTNIIPAQYLSLYTAEAIAEDVRLMKEAGLNIVRVHAHVNRPEFYAACDEAGLMVWQDFALQWSYDDTPAFAAEACRQIREMVRLLRDHPAVVCWCCHNEPVGQEHTLDPLLVRAVLAEDGSRIVRSHSDFKEHPYPGWYYGDRHAFAALPGAPLVTEFGAQALPDVRTLTEILPEGALWPPDWERWSYHDFQYEQTVWIAGITPGDSLEDFVARSQAYQAVLLLDAIDHYRRARYAPITGVFQFMFVDGWPSITWSVLDHRRRPKAGYEALKAAMAPLYLSMRLPAPRHRAGLPLPVQAAVINDRHESVTLSVHFSLTGPDRGLLAAWTPIEVVVGPDALVEITAELEGHMGTQAGWRGPCVLEGALLVGGTPQCVVRRVVELDALPEGLAAYKAVEML